MKPLPLITLDPKALKPVVLAAPTESDALIIIFRVVYQQWDHIEKIGVDENDKVTYPDGHVHYRQSWPACNKATWKAICNWFIELTVELNRKRAFDKQVMAGGVWMNNGFTTTDEELKDWKVRPAPYTLKDKTA